MLTKSEHIVTSCQLPSNHPNWPNPAFSANRLKSYPYVINQIVGEGQSSNGLPSAVLISVF